MNGHFGFILDSAKEFEWVGAGNCNDFAIKTFETAVGPKEAYLFVSQSESAINPKISGPVVVVRVNYVSEGRNILEREFFEIPFKHQTQNNFINELKLFLIAIDELINKSYARKLFLARK